MSLPRPYGESLALLTDLYEVTMACGYWKSGMAEQEAVFHLFFRKHPFSGGFSIAAGLEPLVKFLQAFRFDAGDCDYLRTLRDNAGQPLFPSSFLEALAAMELRCDVDAVPEGTVVFPEEPLLRISGPVMQCQLLESALLNLTNFHSLIATKAARVCLAAQGDPVIEFGLRRAQGIDGSLAASRSAYAGGCAATSNVLAGKLYGIPVKGTHAHSWVMAFPSEQEAFQAYAEAMPDNCILLVDTYDTIEGVRRAVETGQWLAQRGHRLAGVRLDSGDLALLSREARRLLDDAGFSDAAVVASNELDEYVIADLKRQGAPIGIWGVGTKLATAYEEPALGGVYKLSAIREPGTAWSYRVKLSDDPGKASTPGILQVRRFRDDSRFHADVIYDANHPLPDTWMMNPLGETAAVRQIPSGLASEDLLAPVFRRGRCVYDLPALDDIRRRTAEQLEHLPEAMKRLKGADAYPVGLEEGLSRRKKDLMAVTGQA